ncbi:conserved hypothetical protein [Hahella chejuensis KCTC 2396]|uniref:MSHA pilin protein MshD n=1 Tax=Hahella chejuensis (strain KCTC 2396) TaxID=349521 RepID=Q2S983_HAHCH|nr:type II secretion system protein [Hahella chejuensis]ABC32791.1 conserved hypothetical protein [Hahella chejuensis KCTC 2396]
MKAFANPERQRGVTLVELVITIIVIGVALVAIVTAMSGSIGRSSDVLLRNRTIQLAQAYLDEILGKRYDEATPSGGAPPVTSCNIVTEEGSRDEYDDVDDYDGVLNEAPRSQTDADFNNYPGYLVSVSVTCAGADIGLSASNAKLVRVTITPPSGPAMTFSAYRANF